METELNNTATILGNYNSIPTEISTQALVITMLNGLTATKTADKMIWSDGLLTYTITVNNQAEESYTSPVITDMLDTSLISFVKDSITIDNVKIDSSQYTWDETSGKLTINLPDIQSKAKKSITFQVSKKQ